MGFSKLFFDIRNYFEGCKLNAYQDSAGIWTIGFGTTYYPDNSRVKQGDTCTIEQAIEYGNSTLAHLYNHVIATTPKGIESYKIDAIGDFCYNAGQGAWDSSTLKTVINNDHNNYDAIESQFKVWSKAHVNGQLVTVAGLLRRRECEAYLYKNGENAENFLE